MKLIKISPRHMRQPLQIFGLGVIGLLDSLVMILSLGHATSDLRAWYLFEFLDDN